MTCGGLRFTSEVSVMVYDINGNPLNTGVQILVGAVLDADSDAARFSAMKQLLDIGKKKLDYPDSTISPSEYSYATKGAVCALPVGNTAMYEQYPFSMLYSKGATTQDIPASTTKVMALITGLDYVKDIKKVIAIKSSDVQAGSGNYFSAGDTMTIEELMLAMMLPSSNTAAQAFARICGAAMLEAAGDSTYTDTECKTEFVSKMNAKAAYIGMTNSTFDSPSGLSQSTKMTVADMIQMVVEACSYPEILKVWNKKSYSIAVGGTNPRTVTLETTVANQALEDDYFILGGKTGSLDSGTTAAALVMVAMVK